MAIFNTRILPNQRKQHGSIDPLLVFSDGSTSILSNGLASGFGSPADIGNGVIRSTSSTLGKINTQADTELIGSNARTTFSFSDLTGNGLDGTTFVFYAENDIFSFGNDTATFTGSIANNDLALFMFDTAAGGLSVKLTGEGITGANLSLFGAGIWTAWGTALEFGDLAVLSSNGANFSTEGDLGLALAFTLTGTSAEVVVNYDTQPMPPLPKECTLDADGNERVDALTDGLLFLRYMFGIRGVSLVKNAIASNCSFCVAAEIEPILDQCAATSTSDIDGNGNVDALTDGLLLIRFILGIRGSALITDSVGNGCSRCTELEIEGYIQGLIP